MSADGRLNPINWFKRRGSNDSDTTDIPDLPPTIQYNGEHHISYNVIQIIFLQRLYSFLTKHMTYRSLEVD